MMSHDNEHYTTLIGGTADELARLPGQDKADRAVRLADEIKRLAGELATRAGPRVEGEDHQAAEITRLQGEIEGRDNTIDALSYKLAELEGKLDGATQPTAAEPHDTPETDASLHDEAAVEL